MLSELPPKLKFSLLNNVQVVLVGPAEFLKLSYHLVFDLSLVRHDLLLDFFINDVNADLFETLSSLENSLDDFCDLLVVLLLFFFFEELFIHDLIDLFMHDLIELPLLHIIEVLHHVEILGELPELAREIKPSPQCVLT